MTDIVERMQKQPMGRIKHFIFTLAIRVAEWACQSGCTYDWLAEAKKHEDAYREVYND